MGSVLKSSNFSQTVTLSQHNIIFFSLASLTKKNDEDIAKFRAMSLSQGVASLVPYVQI